MTDATNKIPSALTIISKNIKIRIIRKLHAK